MGSDYKREVGPVRHLLLAHREGPLHLSPPGILRYNIYGFLFIAWPARYYYAFGAIIWHFHAAT